LSSIATASDPLKARVVNVLSGDTLIVSIDHQAEIVQLYGVECPERGEAGWLKARDYTEQLVLYKQIVLEPVGAQRAGTIQAKVYVGELCINDAVADRILALK
jgi:endonuclease YncB( thermonuclease family)